MSRKNDKEDELDTETTFVDMNVDGFKWYDPSKKKFDDKKTVKPKLSRKEYWRMVRGAFAALAPYVFILLAAFGIVIALAYLWLS